MFLSQSIIREGLPFEITKPQPNAETLATMLKSMKRFPKRYNTFREIIDEIDAEIQADENNV